MEQAFDTLLKLLELPEDARPAGKLVELEVDESQKSWHLAIELERPLPLESFRQFIDGLENLPLFLNTCNRVYYRIEYETEDYQRLEEYYRFALERLVRRKPRFQAIVGFETERDGRKLTIVCPKDGDFAEELLIDVQRQLFDFGFDVELTVRYCEQTPSIAEQIERERESEEAPSESGTDAESAPRPARFVRHYRRKIQQVSHAIEDVPFTEDDLLEYRSAHRNTDFTLEGVVHSVESRRIKKETTLYTFILSSGNDSIYVKKFVKDKNEADYLEGTLPGMRMRVDGSAQLDRFTDDVAIIANVIERTDRAEPSDDREETAESSRVELHLHSNMSTLDGIDPIEQFVEAAKRFNQPALALTDHNSVQSFPEFYAAAKKAGIKPIFGAEFDVIDEARLAVAWGENEADLEAATYTVFDLETTDLSVHEGKIIEISAARIKDHQVIDRFDSFVDPDEPLSDFTKRLTGISDKDLKGAPSPSEALEQFRNFIEGTILVAHNAPFDLAHLEANLEAYELEGGPYAVIDTLQLARQFYADKLKRFNLKAVAKYFGVELARHHRAEYDTQATAGVFMHMLADLHKAGIKTFEQLKNLHDHVDLDRYRHAMEGHMNVLVKNAKGLKNLYELISLANTKYYSRGAKLPKSVLKQHREGLLIGSGCMNGDLFDAALNESTDVLRERARFFDYIELLPPEDHAHLKKDMDNPVERVQQAHRRMLKTGRSLEIPVVSVGDAHHVEKSSVRYRDIYIRTPIVGGGYHSLARYDEIPSQYFRTTEEMLKSFSYLGEEAERVVVEDTRQLAERVEHFEAFNDELYAPTDDFLALEGIPSIEDKLKDMVYKQAQSLYGEPLPTMVEKRLDQEMESITRNKFSTVYYISHLLVRKSLEDGYLVGSRGSVGSSLVATLMDITEVNPLPPHYACPSCHFTAFKMTEEEKQKHGLKEGEKGLQSLLEDVDSGFDLKPMPCPHCEETLRRDGHDIPFETFLGFKGDKVPDIDLNFSGEYQPEVHEYVRTMFGRERAFRAGTISTVAQKTAYGYVKGYAEKKGLRLRRAEIDRRANAITGVKRSTGQHPGGIVVVPSYKEITDVTPVQYPGDDTSKAWKTTHFDYHSFEDNLFKLDVLGHDDPTMIRFLMDFVREDPVSFPFSDAREIPLDDPKVYRLLSGTEVLGLKPADIKSEVASYGVPEMGTSFVRGMLKDSRPSSFADIVKISGLSHGTDVWLNNAEQLVNGRTKFGRIPFSEVIGCRDDIMVYLIQAGMPSEKAFEISEFIRKGKAEKQPDIWEGYKRTMREYDIPEWYIWSAGRIKYMFPKAHATAYVIMALRIAWFKLYRPIHFYSAYFSKRASDFDLRAMQGGEYYIRERLEDIAEKGTRASGPEQRLHTVLEVALEMVKRGFYFAPISISESAATDFRLTADSQGLRMPFVALDGLGERVARSIVEAREEKLFTSQEDLKRRTLLSGSLVDKLDALDAFGDLPETSQLSLDI